MFHTQMKLKQAFLNNLCEPFGNARGLAFQCFTPENGCNNLDKPLHMHEKVIGYFEQSYAFYQTNKSSPAQDLGSNLIFELFAHL